MAVKIPYSSTGRSLIDYVLQPAFYLAHLIFSLTLVQLLCAVFIVLPLYIGAKALSVFPSFFIKLRYLLTRYGRAELVRKAQRYRRYEEDIAKEQLNGAFRFRKGGLIRLSEAEKNAIKTTASWTPHTEELEVCGATVNVVVERPRGALDSGKTVVVLHGEQSWSYMWRDIIPHLTSSGHTVLALDLLGHGLSDRPTSSPQITLDLHIRTLITLFSHYSLLKKPTTIIAHDWAGCIFTCAAPHILPTRDPYHPPRLLLLNSFLPPHPTSPLIFLTTSLLGQYLPSSVLLRLASPLNIIDSTVRGYSAPVRAIPRIRKTAAGGFALLTPALPVGVLQRLRYRRVWLMLEGLLGPAHFTNFNAQAALAERGVQVREYWLVCARLGWRVGVVCGKKERALARSKRESEGVVDHRALVKGLGEGKGWIEGAGWWPVEERAGEVVRVVEWFVTEGDRR